MNQEDRVFVRDKLIINGVQQTMTQGILPFKYEQEKTNGGSTALGGLPLYLRLCKSDWIVQIHSKKSNNKKWLTGTTAA